MSVKRGKGQTDAARAKTITELQKLIKRAKRCRRKNPRKVSIEALQSMLDRVTSPRMDLALAVMRSAAAERSAPLTVEERLDALEQWKVATDARLFVIEQITSLLKVITAVDGTKHLMTLCRLGVCTSFWLEKAIGEGAGLSVGAVDPFAVYGEIDEVWCRTRPSVAGYFSNCAVNPYGQQNIAIVGNACNSGAGNYGAVLSMDTAGRGYKLRLEGIELLGDYNAFFIGKDGQNPLRVYP
jgi:hypothetical protein